MMSSSGSPLGEAPLSAEKKKKKSWELRSTLNPEAGLPVFGRVVRRREKAESTIASYLASDFPTTESFFRPTERDMLKPARLIVEDLATIPRVPRRPPEPKKKKRRRKKVERPCVVDVVKDDISKMEEAPAAAPQQEALDPLPEVLDPYRAPTYSWDQKLALKGQPEPRPRPRSPRLEREPPF